MSGARCRSSALPAASTASSYGGCGERLEAVGRRVAEVGPQRRRPHDRPPPVERACQQSKVKVVVVGEDDGGIGEHLTCRDEHGLNDFADPAEHDHPVESVDGFRDSVPNPPELATSGQSAGIARLVQNLGAYPLLCQGPRTRKRRCVALGSEAEVDSEARRLVGGMGVEILSVQVGTDAHRVPGSACEEFLGLVVGRERIRCHRSQTASLEATARRWPPDGRRSRSLDRMGPATG